MGTGYKGGTTKFHSIGQNIMITSKSYTYDNGRFGIKSPHGGNDKRNIISKDNLATANDFYDKIANGGIEKHVNDNLSITRMNDGTVIAMRKKSTSDGTPVVEINIKSSRNSSGIKSQKIHFVQEQ